MRFTLFEERLSVNTRVQARLVKGSLLDCGRGCADNYFNSLESFAEQMETLEFVLTGKGQVIYRSPRGGGGGCIRLRVGR